MGLAPSDEGAADRKYESSETVWIELPGGRRLPLLPFFIPPEQYMADFSSNVQLFVYEQHTSRRNPFTSVRSSQTVRPLVNPL